MFGAPPVRLVSGVFGHEDDDASFFLSACSAASLDVADGAGDGLVEDDGVHFWDVKAFFCYAGGDEHVEEAVAELVEHFDLFLLA